MCDEDERVALEASAQQLNARMREIRSTGRIVGGERIAVMTALNLIHELMQHDTIQTVAEQTLLTRLKSLDANVSSTLERIRQTERQSS